MKLQDYLPYYLGVDYWTNNSQGNLNAETLPHVIDMCQRNCGVQLHLRRLEDITDEEKRECDKQIHKYDTGNGSSHFITDWAYRVDWLIKHRFDIFGLIDAGLSIDSKTFK